MVPDLLCWAICAALGSISSAAIDCSSVRSDNGYAEPYQRGYTKMTKTNLALRIGIATMMLGSVGGCATAQPAMTPGGGHGFIVDCSGTSMSACYSKAGQLCGASGYKVFEKSDLLATSLFSGADKHLLIQCKNDGAKDRGK